MSKAIYTKRRANHGKFLNVSLLFNLALSLWLILHLQIYRRYCSPVNLHWSPFKKIFSSICCSLFLLSLSIHPPVTDLWLCVQCLPLLREKMESQLEKEARFCQLMAHSSHDSAIDTDSLEWETEVVEFEKDRVGKTALSSYYWEWFGDMPVSREPVELWRLPKIWYWNLFVNSLTFICIY